MLSGKDMGQRDREGVSVFNRAHAWATGIRKGCFDEKYTWQPCNVYKCRRPEWLAARERTSE